MSLYGMVLAIGPFHRDATVHLEYPANFYERTRAGSLVARELFVISGTQLTTEFAKLLGIDDPWDFNQHRLDPRRIRADELRAFLSELGGDDAEDNLKDLDRMLALGKLGFQLLFCPRG